MIPDLNAVRALCGVRFPEGSGVRRTSGTAVGTQAPGPHLGGDRGHGRNLRNAVNKFRG